jgi:hypothetical protein
MREWKKSKRIRAEGDDGRAGTGESMANEGERLMT